MDKYGYDLWDGGIEPILGPPVLACGPGEMLVTLADGGQVCVGTTRPPAQPVCGPGREPYLLPTGDWECRPVTQTTTCPNGMPPVNGVCGPAVIGNGNPTTTTTPPGGTTTPPTTDPLQNEPAGIVATLMGEDGTNIFGFKPIVAIGAAVAAFFVIGGGKK